MDAGHLIDRAPPKIFPLRESAANLDTVCALNRAAGGPAKARDGGGRLARPSDGDIADWVERWGDRLVGFAWTYLHDAELAQDVAQETFLRLVKDRRRMARREVHPGWLFAVARRICLDHLRRPAARTLPGAEVADPHSAKAFLAVDVESVLRQLKPADRECLWLFYYGGLSVAEIAQLLGIPPDRAKARLYRARQRFGAEWRADEAARPAGGGRPRANRPPKRRARSRAGG